MIPMKPSLAQALMTLSMLGIAGGVEPGGPPRRRQQVPGPLPPLYPSLSPYSSGPSELPPAAAERVRLATELRARRAAKLERLAANGAIRRAGT